MSWMEYMLGSASSYAGLVFRYEKVLTIGLQANIILMLEWRWMHHDAKGKEIYSTYALSSGLLTPYNTARSHKSSGEMLAHLGIVWG